MTRTKEFMTKGELREIAENAVRKRAILGSEYFSPAEAFAGFAAAIIDYQVRGSLLSEIKADHPLGPVKMPDSQPGVSKVTLEEVYELAGQSIEHIGQAGSLPSTLDVRGSRVGAGSLFALFSSVYLDMNSKSPDSEYEVPVFDPYPRTNENEIVEVVRKLKSWPVHRLDLDMEKIVELTKLQLWTLKPAHRR